MNEYRPRRSLLFTPGDRARCVRKAATLATDVVIVDLEDSVHPGQKEAARQETGAVLAEIDFGGREVALRVNAWGSAYFEDDVAALACYSRKPDLVVIPKVDSSAGLLAVSDALERRGIQCGLIPCIESAAGVLAAAEIARSAAPIAGLMLGGHDLVAVLGVAYSWEALLFARGQVLFSAVAASIDPIDTVWTDLTDEAGLAAVCGRARRLGYVGTAAIHPKQLALINDTFSPTPEEMAWA